MTNALVLNLETLAVTEYTTPFTGLSGNFECTADGVYEVGGNTDDGVAIAAGFSFGLRLSDSARQKRAKYLYLHGTGGANMRATVTDGQANAYTYLAQSRHGRATRFVLGAGIRDSYLQFALASTSPTPFIIDRIVFETPESASRRL